ncbi:hypothetical protein [Nakamurella sp.]|uniref:hypothetical protein n=1 Tax=Nakamurella sp. TaxID=1869182 RepID=UPI003B3AF8A8
MTARPAVTPGRRPLTLRLVSLAVGGLLVTPSLAACGSDHDGTEQTEQTVYCVDGNDQVVDEALCDESNPGAGSHFLMFAAAGYLIGSRLPAGGSRIAPTDQAARSAAGLAATGRAAGTVVKSGGIGRGSSGSDGSSGG